MTGAVLLELGRDGDATTEELALRRAGRGALILLDVGGFAEIRATLGMRSSNLLLAELERAIVACCRRDDAIHRVGMDRYVIVARHVVTSQAAEAVAARLLHRIDRLELEGRPLCLTVAAGICFFPQEDADAHEVVRRAEASAIAGRAAGQRVSFYEEAVDADRDLSDTLLGGELRRALLRDELFLVYQPKLSLLTGELAGAEALMRWRSPTRGDVSPGRFVPVAERTGHIRALTDLALTAAGTMARRWHLHAPPGFRVSVNLSGAELHEQGRAAGILEQLRRVGAPLERIELEVTESSLMTRPERARQVLAELHDAGIRIAVDDFGTGHSSLAWLADLPVQVLKVDRRFVRELDRPNVRALLRSIVDLGHALDLTIVAEGIETPAQLELVRDLGADVAQGFLLARPGAAEAVSFGPHPAILALPHPTRGLPERLPLLPSVVQELARFRDEPATAAGIEQLAMADPGLAIAILQLSGERSLGRALARVGPGRVVEAVLGSATARVFLPDRATRSRIRTACQAAAIAPGAGVDPDVAYVAGLLHDVGTLVQADCAADGDPVAIGTAWCRMVGLPRDLVLVVERHAGGDLSDLAAPQRALVSVVRQARALAATRPDEVAERVQELASRAGL